MAPTSMGPKRCKTKHMANLRTGMGRGRAQDRTQARVWMAPPRDSDRHLGRRAECLTLRTVRRQPKKQPTWFRLKCRENPADHQPANSRKTVVLSVSVGFPAVFRLLSWHFAQLFFRLFSSCPQCRASLDGRRDCKARSVKSKRGSRTAGRGRDFTRLYSTSAWTHPVTTHPKADSG